MSLSFKNKRISSLVAQIQNSGWDLFPKTGIYCFLSIHVAYGTVTEHRQLKCRTHGRQTIIWTDRKIKAKTNILCFLRRRQTLCYSPFWVFFFFFLYISLARHKETQGSRTCTTYKYKAIHLLSHTKDTKYLVSHQASAPMCS